MAPGIFRRGLNLPTRGLKYGFQGTINAKNLRKNRFSPSDGRLACSDVLFYLDLESEICNFADDTTIYACDKSIDTVIVKLEDDLQKILNWFKENGMCANPAKFQMIFLGLKINNLLCLNTDGQKIKQSEHVKLLGVQIDNKLNFNVHIKELCKKMNQKLCAFSRIRPFLNREKAKILLTSIVMSNLSYCPLIWMFCSKLLTKR